ncbi:hypothetical protein J6590_008084 [Homalodisca vitripennis]|nr:hypothetical protein J6590_008084 [Homalodisca vitripennis]
MLCRVTGQDTCIRQCILTRFNEFELRHSLRQYRPARSTLLARCNTSTHGNCMVSRPHIRYLAASIRPAGLRRRGHRFIETPPLTNQLCKSDFSSNQFRELRKTTYLPVHRLYSIGRSQ